MEGLELFCIFLFSESFIEIIVGEHVFRRDGGDLKIVVSKR